MLISHSSWDPVEFVTSQALKLQVIICIRNNVLKPQKLMVAHIKKKYTVKFEAGNEIN